MRLNSGSIAVVFALARGLSATLSGHDVTYDFHINHLELDGVTRTVANRQSSSLSRLSSIRLTCMRVAYQNYTQVSRLWLVEGRGNGT